MVTNTGYPMGLIHCKRFPHQSKVSYNTLYSLALSALNIVSLWMTETFNFRAQKWVACSAVWKPGNIESDTSDTEKIYKIWMDATQKGGNITGVLFKWGLVWNNWNTNSYIYIFIYMFENRVLQLDRCKEISNCRRVYARGRVWLSFCLCWLMAQRISKDIRWHLWLLFLHLQITRSDISLHIKWVVRMVIAYDHFNLPQSFVWVYIGWYNHFIIHLMRVLVIKENSAAFILLLPFYIS